MKNLDSADARSRIEHEDNLINHRVSWLIGSQSFLFTAFVLLRNSSLYYEAPGGVPFPLAYLERTASLVYFISVIGIAISLCSFIGVVAAFFAIRAWSRHVDRSQRAHLTSRTRIALFGGLAAILPSPIIASIWISLLASEWPTISRNLAPITVWTPIAVTSVVVVVWLLFHWQVLLFAPRDED